MKFGDRNNAYFHAQTMIKRGRNEVEGLHIVGDICSTNLGTLEREALGFFKKLFIADDVRHP